MTAKEYLSQARFLDMQIKSKLDQLQSLNDLATKCTSVISDMPKMPNKSVSSMADTIHKIIDLQCEINRDIDEMVHLKNQIVHVIDKVKKTDYRMILEKRYLCFQNWEEIAADMSLDLRWLYRLHGRALEAVGKIYEEMKIDH